MIMTDLLCAELAGVVARHGIEIKRIGRIKAEHGDAISPELSDTLDTYGVAALDLVIESRRLELGITTSVRGGK